MFGLAALSATAALCYFLFAGSTMAAASAAVPAAPCVRFPVEDAKRRRRGGVDYIKHLPYELLAIVFAFLAPNEIFAAQLFVVCRDFNHTICTDPRIWTGGQLNLHYIQPSGRCASHIPAAYNYDLTFIRSLYLAITEESRQFLLRQEFPCLDHLEIRGYGSPLIERDFIHYPPYINSNLRALRVVSREVMNDVAHFAAEQFPRLEVLSLKAFTVLARLDTIDHAAPIDASVWRNLRVLHAGQFSLRSLCCLNGLPLECLDVWIHEVDDLEDFERDEEASVSIPTLRSVNIGTPDEDSRRIAAALVRWVNKMTGLVYLALNCATIHLDGIHLPNIETLVIQDCESADFNSWVETVSRFPPTLKFLYLGFASFGGSPFCEEYNEVVRGALRTLEWYSIRFYGGDDEDLRASFTTPPGDPDFLNETKFAPQRYEAAMFHMGRPPKEGDSRLVPFFANTEVYVNESAGKLLLESRYAIRRRMEREGW